MWDLVQQGNAGAPLLVQRIQWLNPDSLGQMPWWGDDALASTIASQVFNQPCPGWDADYGPVFATARSTQPDQVLGLAQSLRDVNDQIDVTVAASVSSRYTIASSPPTVPVPLPVLGAAAGFRWSRRLRRRAR